MKTKSYYLDLICMYLGGLAAEALVFGEFGEASAGEHSSDLGMATSLATRVEGCFGMGRTLAIEIVSERDLPRLRSSNDRLRGAVGELLDEQFTRAKKLLDIRRNALVSIADELIEKKALSGLRIGELTEKHPPVTDPLGVGVGGPGFAQPVSRRAIDRLHEGEVRKEIDAALRRWGML